MAWLSWRPGRQGTGYHKMLIFQWRWFILFDLYLLRYLKGSFVPVHHDPVSGYRHYRFNFVLKQAKRGGEFKSQHIVYQGNRMKIFRSDFPHEVSMIDEGTRYVLSLGVCLKKRSQ